MIFLTIMRTGTCGEVLDQAKKYAAAAAVVGAGDCNAIRAPNARARRDQLCLRTAGTWTDFWNPTGSIGAIIDNERGHQAAVSQSLLEHRVLRRWAGWRRSDVSAIRPCSAADSRGPHGERLCAIRHVSLAASLPLPVRVFSHRVA